MIYGYLHVINHIPWASEAVSTKVLQRTWARGIIRYWIWYRLPRAEIGPRSRFSSFRDENFYSSGVSQRLLDCVLLTGRQRTAGHQTLADLRAAHFLLCGRSEAILQDKQPASNVPWAIQPSATPIGGAIDG